MTLVKEFLRDLRAELDQVDPVWRSSLRADLDSTYPDWETFSITIWDQYGTDREVVILANHERISS